MEMIPGRAGRTRGRLEGAWAFLMRKNRTNAQQAHHVPGPRLSSLRRGPYSLLNTPGGGSAVTLILQTRNAALRAPVTGSGSHRPRVRLSASKPRPPHGTGW